MYYADTHINWNISKYWCCDRSNALVVMVSIQQQYSPLLMPAYCPFHVTWTCIYGSVVWCQTPCLVSFHPPLHRPVIKKTKQRITCNNLTWKHRLVMRSTLFAGLRFIKCVGMYSVGIRFFCLILFICDIYTCTVKTLVKPKCTIINPSSAENLFIYATAIKPLHSMCVPHIIL